MKANKPFIVQDGKAFVHCRGDMFLCIGTVSEARRAENDPVLLGRMIMVALAEGQYNQIESAEGQTKH